MASFAMSPAEKRPEASTIAARGYARRQVLRVA